MRSRRSKSDLIRAHAAKHPADGPTAVATALARQGVNVSPAHVASALRFNERRPLSESSEEAVTVLFEVKRLVDDYGFDRVKWAIAALERFQEPRK